MHSNACYFTGPDKKKYRREFQLNDPRKRVLMRFSVYLGISMIKSAGNNVYFAHFKAVLQCPTCTWWLVSPEVSSAAVLVVGLSLSFSVCLGRCRWLAFPCIRSLPSHLAQGRCRRRTIFWCWPGVCLVGRRSTGYARRPWAHAFATQAPPQIHRWHFSQHDCCKATGSQQGRGGDEAKLRKLMEWVFGSFVRSLDLH